MGEIVEVVDYNPEWEKLYQAEAARLRLALGNLLAGLEHIGSTSVPGLAAKPIIDIMVGVHKISDAKACVDILTERGYVYVPEFEVSIPERRFFHRVENGRRTHHLHLVEVGSQFWKEHILFRDVLRTHEDVAEQYATLKRGLAARYREDRFGYTDAKSDFILGVMEKFSSSSK